MAKKLLVITSNKENVDGKSFEDTNAAVNNIIEKIGDPNITSIVAVDPQNALVERIKKGGIGAKIRAILHDMFGDKWREDDVLPKPTEE